MPAARQSAGRTQADRAFHQIRVDILACRLRPGTKLKINDLCERFAWSLGSVREALSRLSADGLVIATPQKGYSVAPVSRDDLLDLTHARIEIETTCLAQSIEHADMTFESDVLAAFHELRHLPERSAEDGVRLNDDWSTAHDAFHSALVSACPSKWLLRMRAMLFEQAERYRQLSVPLRTEERDVTLEHHEIVKAILSRDIERVTALTAQHLRTTTQILLANLDLPGEGDARPAGTARRDCPSRQRAGAILP